jgi:hypothetical protein
MTGTRPPSCRAPRMARRHRARPAARRDAVIGWEALSAAVAVLAARRDGDANLRSGIVRDEAPERVILGLEIVAAAALAVLMPEDEGARALEALGLLALERRAER